LFFYDLGDPESYLAAERVDRLLPEPAEWVPVDAVGLAEPAALLDREEIEAIAAERGMQPLRWPTPWPAQSRRALLAATYAKGAGRATAFSLAAFRQAFAGGRDLADDDTLVLAGAACELHPRALLPALERQSLAAALDRATARAAAGGVRRVPAVQAAGTVFHGDGGIDAAAAAIGADAGGKPGGSARA
jgi:2-hydroxychromene-2-carboxylate isomerase